MLQRTFLTGLAVTVLVVQACGSDDGKKRTMQGSDAGMGGEAGMPAGPDSGGSGAGAPPSTAGEPNVPTAGMGGSGEEPLGGTGGQPQLPPDPELLFVVRDDAVGLADSAVEDATNKQNVIYTTRSAQQDEVNGTNDVKVVGTDLGLAEADAIIAFAELQPEPASPLYLFSVTDGTEGAWPTTTYEQYWDGVPTAGDVFFSDGIESYRYVGEGGDQYGYNGLSFAEVSLGLSQGVDEASPDQLHDLQARDANVPLSELFFTSNASAEGATDTAVAATPADERGCTVFRSELDGTNTVVFSCAQLGLAPGDQIDALAVYGDGSPEQVVFSVTVDALGVAGSAVALASGAPDTGAHLFSSTGDGGNSVVAEPHTLGLGGTFYTADEIDGLTVLDAPTGSVAAGVDCTTTFDPFAAGGGELISNSGVVPIGPDVAVLVGRKANLVTSLVAFDIATCDMLQQKDMTNLLEVVKGTAIVRLANWSKATPLDNVTFYQPVADGENNLVLQSYDEDGVTDDAYPITGFTIFDSVEALVQDPAGNQFYLVTRDQYDYQLRLSVFPVPDANTTAIDTQSAALPSPCNSDPNYNGVDSNGVLYLSQVQADGASFRVCKYSPAGQLMPTPYFWTPGTAPEHSGFIAGGRVHVSVTTNNGAAPLTIERGVYALP